MTTDLRAALATHPFCEGLLPRHLAALLPHAALVRLGEGELLFRSGERAHASWLLRSGRVGLVLHAAEVVETVEAGELLGWSWLVGGWRWHADARALAPVEAIRLDGDALTIRCEAEPELGFALSRRALRFATSRLERSRLHARDVFGGGR